MSEEFPTPPPALPPVVQTSTLPPTLPPALPAPKSTFPTPVLFVILGIVGFLGISILAGLVVPVILKMQKKARISQAFSNAGEIGQSLMEFDNKYDSFPNDKTAQILREKSQTDLTLGNSSSNDYFRQLIAAGICYGEKIFYAKTPETHIPDNDTTGSHCLERGECAFTYVLGLSTDDNNAPILLAPMIPGTTTFDTKPFDGKAIILHCNGTTTAEKIDSSVHVMVNGMDLFDPKQPFWHGKTPQLRYPKL
jgi:hypothetical protein